MSKTITLTGEDAETAQRAVAEVRRKCPKFADISDNDIINILVNAALLSETEPENTTQVRERSPL